MPSVSIQRSSDLSEETYEVSDQESLYQEILNRGVDLPHGCLSGSCGACRIEVLEGEKNLSPISLIEQNTVDSLKEEFGLTESSHKVIRLACRAKVKGPIKIRPL